MARMEHRVSCLESQLSGVLESMDALTLQITVIQDFLQKQFGSRFVDYAVNRGVYIEKPAPSRIATSTYYGSGSITATSTQGMRYHDVTSMGLFGGREEIRQDDDPMACVEIIEEHNKQEESYCMGGQEENGYYDEDDQYGDLDINITRPSSSSTATYGTDKSKKDTSEPLSNAKNRGPPIPIPFPPLKNNAVPMMGEVQKTKVSSNSMGGARKRPSLPSSSIEPASVSKVPLLQPQSSLEGQEEYNEMLDFSSLTTSDGSLDAINYNLDSMKNDPDCNEDLREFYDVLPDKSVQCKICDKILKAGWHKFGRHYRTHTGEKPFSCPVCGENFARKDNMNNHIKSKHENKRPRPGSADHTTLISDGSEYSSVYYLSSEFS